MLKSPLLSQFLLSATILCLPLTLCSSAKAAQFEQSEVNAQLFIAIARPYGDNKHDLLILQQIPGKRQCWQEQGSKPATVVPLLLNFDFTGICDRSTDSNGYSIRVDGKDLGLEYLLKVVKKEDDLWLVGASRVDPNQPDVLIGRTHGITQGFLKIELEPGWRFTKRTFRGQVLSHVYLTGDRAALTTPSSPPNRAANALTTPKNSAPKNSAPKNSAIDTALSSQPLKELTFTAESDLSAPATNRTALPPLPVAPRSLSNRATNPLPLAPNNATLPPLPVPSVNPPRPTTTPATTWAPPSTQQPLPPLSPRPNPPGNTRSLPPVPVPRSVTPSTTSAPPSGQFPPPPLPAMATPPSRANTSALPPLPPPPAGNNLPPAPLPSSGARRSLSDVMAVSPRGGTPPPPTSAMMNTQANLSSWDRPPVPRPPSLTETGERDRSMIANQSSFRVLVNPGNQKDEVRSRYPDAFATQYQGRSLWQIGRFNSQENAEKALDDLSNLGIQGIIVP